MSEPAILPSAHRHGITDEDMHHAYRNAIDAFPGDDGLVMYVGADQTGRLLEIGVVPTESGPAIAHAMPARPKYLRQR